jgi:hypothetical protein
MGGHVWQCQSCGDESITYNSCGNRHCPRCQYLAKARWLQAREAELLPVPYFHGVFTQSHVLNPIVRCNPELLYDLLFKSVSATLQEVAGTKLKGAQLGFIAVLHTWGQNLMQHPHLHLIIPGGGLSQDQSTWIPSSEKFLLPKKVLAKVFRGKYLSALEEMFNQGRLQFPGSTKEFQNPGRFKNLLIQAASQDWVVYLKRPFAGPMQVLNYLGNYTHRIAISNYRLLSLENDHITFLYRDYRDSGKTKTMRLHVAEFMRRFLLHVLPPRFVRIRHYGFLGSRSKKVQLEKLRGMLGPTRLPPAPAPEHACTDQKTAEVVKSDLLPNEKPKSRPCRKCKEGRLAEIRVIEPWKWHRRRKRVWLGQRRQALGLRSSTTPGFDTS